MSLWTRFCKRLAWAGYSCSIAVCVSAVFRPDHGIWFGLYAMHLVVFIPFVTAVRALREMNYGRRLIEYEHWRRLRLLLPDGLKRLLMGTVLFAVLAIGTDVYRDLVLKVDHSRFQGPKSMSLELKTWITLVSPDDFVASGAIWAVFFLLSACLLTMRENWSPENTRKGS
jgi:hypothetical protein